MNTIKRYIAALAIALMLGSSFHLDDHGHEMRASADLQDAIKSGAIDARFARAAAAMCGNGAYRVSDDNAVVCINRKTRKEAL